MGDARAPADDGPEGREGADGRVHVDRAPLVALSGRRWLGRTVDGLPANFDDLGIDLHIGAYADAVSAAGGLPIMLPCTASALAVLDRVDALVLTGGSDVDPGAYGETARPEVYGIDTSRDTVELALAVRALELGLPLLAICRGMQVLNVALGGTLEQHLEPGVGADAHAAWHEPAHALVHEVTCMPQSTIAVLYGDRCRVNSLHHQALRVLGHGLVATAHASDGTIEAAEIPGRPVLGVQWHPELVDSQPQPAFRWLVESSSRR